MQRLVKEAEDAQAAMDRERRDQIFEDITIPDSPSTEQLYCEADSYSKGIEIKIWFNCYIIPFCIVTVISFSA